MTYEVYKKETNIGFAMGFPFCISKDGVRGWQGYVDQDHYRTKELAQAAADKQNEELK